MVQVKPGFMVDQHGKPEAVVLSMTDYGRLMRHLEELEDAMDLKRAIRTHRGTISHTDLLVRLKRQHLL